MTDILSSGRRRERLPRYKRTADPPPMQLMARDELIIRWVYELRFATQEQLQRLLFSATTASSCKRRLTLLYHNGYLDRRLLPLRSQFGANRAAYCLEKRGAQLVAFDEKTGRAQIAWRPADNDRELYFLEHTLACNDCRVCITLASRQDNYGLVWTDERTLKSAAMRDFVRDPRHKDERLAVIPDGYFQLTTDRPAAGFALELDRGTVEERPFKTKIRALGEWKVTGAYSRRFNTESLRVLFVVAPNNRDPRRLERIKLWTEAEGGLSLFWFTSLSELSPTTVFHQPIWQVAGRTGKFSLLS